MGHTARQLADSRQVSGGFNLFFNFSDNALALTSRALVVR